MVHYNLSAIIRRAKPGMRRRVVTLREISPPAMLATNLYRSAYLPMLQVWERAAAGIIEAYSKSHFAYVSDSLSDGGKIRGSGALDRPTVAHLTDTADELQARLDAANSELERLFILLDASLREWTVQTERYVREKWRGSVLSATGVDLQTMLGPEDVRDTLATYLRWNTELVRDVSAQTRQRISNAVFSGLQNRTPVRDVAKAISEATGMARDRSKRIAADQLSKISNSLADERRREAGLSIWKWRWSHKRHGRAEHMARDGNLYSDVQADVGRDVDGVGVLAAPEANDLPGRPPYCGCRSQSVLVLD